MEAKQMPKDSETNKPFPEEGKPSAGDGSSPPPYDPTKGSEEPDHKARLPKKIGDFVIKRLIASGGMGKVYEGLQEHPRRPVAIKVMKHGVASGEALRRFAYESQILARLRHPHIAQVYDAGTYDDGSGEVPYFAMEYIPNARSITRYVKEKKLSICEKLELFAKVCDAVHHGHQKGIIHRDLKPDNILIDSSGQPKVIDFGVARATDSDLAVTTLQTEVGQLVGTVQYMSPEQIQADPHDIDTRSDVYALGVVLYEVLAGKLPYDVKNRTPFEAARVIREDSPTRITTIDHTLGGEKETIVLKALEKERDRRYQSAGDLAGDIRRYLNDEPICARPPTVTYQLKVFARRNKALVGAVGAVFAVVVAGAIISTSLYFRAEAERSKAEEERSRAEQQAERAMASIGFMRDMVNSANPVCIGQEVKVGELLDSYSEKIDGAFVDQPEIEAAVRSTIGQTYQILDMFEKAGTFESYQQAAEHHLTTALDLRRRTLGEEDPATLESMELLAGFLESQGNLSGAERLIRHVWEVRRRTLGEEDSLTVDTMEYLAILLWDQDRLDEVEPLIQKILEIRRRVLGEEHWGTLIAKSNVASLLQERGELAEAENLKREILEIGRRVEGEGSKRMRLLTSELAATLIAQGKLAESNSLYGGKRMPESLGIERWIKGKGDPYNSRPTLLVFWEEWCPHSHRALPELQDTYSKYEDHGLEMIGLTEITMNSTEEKVLKCIEANGLTFPIAKGGEEAMSFFGVRGWPSAVMIADGRMVWGGYPWNLTDQIFDGLLGVPEDGD
jgi:thiol-disulfide isomerase/thioredoxin